MVSKRKTGKRRIPAWLLVVAAGGVPLVTSATCDSTDFSLTVFRDRGHDYGGFSDVFTDGGLFFDDCFFDGCF